jgi:hypothetical protein
MNTDALKKNEETDYLSDDEEMAETSMVSGSEGKLHFGVALAGSGVLAVAEPGSSVFAGVPFSGATEADSALAPATRGISCPPAGDSRYWTMTEMRRFAGSRGLSGVRSR